MYDPAGRAKELVGKMALSTQDMERLILLLDDGGDVEIREALVERITGKHPAEVKKH